MPAQRDGLSAQDDRPSRACGAGRNRQRAKRSGALRKGLTAPRGCGAMGGQSPGRNAEGRLAPCGHDGTHQAGAERVWQYDVGVAVEVGVVVEVGVGVKVGGTAVGAIVEYICAVGSGVSVSSTVGDGFFVGVDVTLILLSVFGELVFG